jgi:hypothetical protein
MTITLNGTTGITTPAITDVSTGNVTYTGTLTGGTGVVNLGSGQLVKDASGNLGLGVTPSAWNSSIKALQLVNGSQIAFSGAYGGLQANAYYDTGGTYRYITTGQQASLYQQSGGNQSWSNAPSGTAGNPITFTQAMTLDAGGNLLVGTTTAYGAGTTIAGSYFIQRSASASTGLYRYNAPDASNNYLVYNQANIGMYMTNGGTSWNANSDERLKTDLIPISHAISKVQAIRAVTGRYKTDEVGISRSFVIAQDVLSVYPEAVSRHVLPGDETNTEYLGVAYSDLVPVLLKAIQEQQALINAQQVALDSLTTRLTTLENK